MKKIENHTPCPCQSGKTYGECCQPFHSFSLFPITAEQLMRSRYTAFFLANADYIVQTTVPAQQPLLDVVAIQTWGETTEWAGLEIVQHQQQISKIHSQVEFNAFFRTETSIETHHEKSLFVRINGRWYFADPTVPLPSQKQPCICGSGKKFKHCCGGWL